MNCRICTIVGCKPTKTIINNNGYAHVAFSSFKVVKFLKLMTKKMNLPVLERKWTKIDETYINRTEKGLIFKSLIEKEKNKGYSFLEISNRLGISRSTTYKYFKAIK